MKASDKASIGATNVQVSRLGLGGTALSGEKPAFNPESVTSFEESENLIRTALTLGVAYFDTAPMYGLGESERRLGAGLREVDRRRYALSTKVGRVLNTSGGGNDWSFDFSASGIKSSFTSSLGRLGLESIDIVFIHDPDGDILFSDGSANYFAEAVSEALPALQELKEAGRVGAIGVGMNQWEMELEFAKTGEFDCFLLAGRYTLLDQSALRLFLPYCSAHGISVIAGGPFNSGILAADSFEDAPFNYSTAAEPIVKRAAAIRHICQEHNVPLKAVALQFILAHPAIASVIPGARSASELDENAAMLDVEIPPDLWERLKEAELIDLAAPVPTG